jgi:hypothetical protein
MSCSPVEMALGLTRVAWEVVAALLFEVLVARPRRRSSAWAAPCGQRVLDPLYMLPPAWMFLTHNGHPDKTDSAAAL